MFVHLAVMIQSRDIKSSRKSEVKFYRLAQFDQTLLQRLGQELDYSLTNIATHLIECERKKVA